MAKEDHAAPLVQSSEPPIESGGAHVFQRRWLIVGMVVAIIFVVAAILLARYFPFSQKSVTQSLRETFPGTIKIDHFQTVYFFRPGCNAEGVTFRSVSSAPGSLPLVTIQKLTIRGNYADFLLRPHHISRIILENLRVQIPALGSGGDFSGGYTASRTTTGEVIANGAVVEIARADDKPSLRFIFTNLAWDLSAPKAGCPTGYPCTILSLRARSGRRDILGLSTQVIRARPKCRAHIHSW